MKVIKDYQIIKNLKNLAFKASKNINNILYDYNFPEKRRCLEFLISENEKTIEKIDYTLNLICAHEWTTDEIELPMDRGLQTICYCKVCNIKKE